ncbi:hypothetical protein D3C87_1146510 [compost metagenome]
MFVNGQAALVIGGDAFAGIEVDVGKTQRQAIVLVQAIGLRIRAIAELDALRLDIQRAMAGACAAVGHGAGGLGRAVPDQIGGANGRHITGIAQAVNGRCHQYQVFQAALARLWVQGVESHAANEVE